MVHAGLGDTKSSNAVKPSALAAGYGIEVGGHQLPALELQWCCATVRICDCSVLSCPVLSPQSALR